MKRDQHCKELNMRMSLIALSAALCAAATPAAAVDLGNGFSASVGVSGVSDYRFRGISLSDTKAAVQGSVTINHESGVYAGVWGSSLGDSVEPLYGKVESDLFVGYGTEISPGTSIDLNATFYTYADSPSGTHSDYMEFLGSVKHDFGPAAIKVGGAWAPSMKATGDQDFIYGYGELSAPIPSTPLTFRGHVGVQDLGFASYTDWQLGLETTLGPVSASLSYVDTSIGRGSDILAAGFTSSYDNVKAGVVFSLGLAF